MKIVGIFRGFPGLGRVVSGVELLQYFRREHSAKTFIYTYLQGEVLLKQYNIQSQFSISPLDISSIGIIPVSKYGEGILNSINKIKPDFVLIDGEPLMVQAIKLTYPDTHVIALLNPSDVENPMNQVSSQMFFNHYFSLADLAIVHGLRKVNNPGIYKNFHSVNTIIRNEILNINPVIKSKQIFCILGGGTVNVQNDFLESTLKIANLCFGLALELKDHKITIQCSSSNVYEKINENIKPNQPVNLQLISTIKPPADYYSNTSLIITRAGRNSLSELLFLNIPAISFISGCSFRKEEQASNVQYSQNSQIISLPTDIQLSQFVLSCKELLNTKENEEAKSYFLPGNRVAIELILNHLKKTLKNCNEVVHYHTGL
jgi:hypothetical protein